MTLLFIARDIIYLGSKPEEEGQMLIKEYDIDILQPLWALVLYN